MDRRGRGGIEGVQVGWQGRDGGGKRGKGVGSCGERRRILL